MRAHRRADVESQSRQQSFALRIALKMRAPPARVNSGRLHFADPHRLITVPIWSSTRLSQGGVGDDLAVIAVPSPATVICTDMMPESSESPHLENNRSREASSSPDFSGDDVSAGGEGSVPERGQEEPEDSGVAIAETAPEHVPEQREGASAAPASDSGALTASRVGYSIGEVGEHMDLEAHVLRYWESEFDELSPGKDAAGRRVYTDADVRTLERIRHLLKQERYTIAGARAVLDREGINGRKEFRDDLRDLRDFLVDLRDRV